MSQKNSNVSKKTHKFLLNYLKDKKTFQIYNKFEENLKLNDDFIVAVSGGPDSLALSFLSKIYSIKKSINVKFFIIDHKLRKNSTVEAKYVKKILKKLSISLNILTWIGKKPRSNIQSIARQKRYSLLVSEAKKLKINNILLGHHKDDLIENFFIRILRGTGLNGMISFGNKTEYQKINICRPLINCTKKDLENISKKVFKTYIEDPSNIDENFKRVKIRNLIKNLEFEGLDFNKFILTIKNLKFANESIKFYVEKNLKENSIIENKKKLMFLNKEFFLQPEEVVFRSLTEVIKIVGKKYYPVRGRKIGKVVDKIKDGTLSKITLGNCLIKKVNRTIIVSKEH